MEQLEPMLASHDIPFDATDRRIMCFAHVINLCSGHVIRAVTDGAVDNDAYSLSSDDDDDAHSSSSDDTHPAPNPIQAARAVVRAIRGSGQRRTDFEKLIAQGNSGGWFKEGRQSVQLKNLQLLRDVRTRWDSVYYMLERLREMRLVWFYTLPNVLAKPSM